MKLFIQLSLFIIGLTTLPILSTAQASHLFYRTIEHASNVDVNIVMDMKAANNGYAYTISRRDMNGGSKVSYALYAYDTNGNRQFTYNLDTCTDILCIDNYNVVQPTNDNAAVYLGHYGANIYNNKLLGTKLSNTGAIIWQSTWPIAASPYKTLLDNNGNIIVLLHADTISTGTNRAFAVARISKDSGTIMHMYYHTDSMVNTKDELYRDVVVDNNNNIYVVGTAFDVTTQTEDIVLHKLDTTLQLVYNKKIDSSVFDFYNLVNPKIAYTNNGFLYMAYNTLSNINLVQCIDSTGEILKSNLFKKDSTINNLIALNTIKEKVYLLSNHNYKVPDNSAQGYYFTNNKYNVTKIDSSLNTIWSNTYFKDYFKNANAIGFNGAASMAQHSSKLSISSFMLKDSLHPYIYINRIDTNGNTLWYDSTACKIANVIFTSADKNNNTYTAYSDFNTNNTYEGYVSKYTDYTNFYLPIAFVTEPLLNVAYVNNYWQLQCNTVITSVEVFTLYGQKIATLYNTNTIDRNNFIPNIYLLKIQLANGTAVIQKVSNL